METFSEVFELDPSIHRGRDEDSDSDADPNEAAFRPRPSRQASIRARAVIADACGIKIRHNTIPIKKELAEDAGSIDVDEFLNELQEELQPVIKSQVIMKKSEEFEQELPLFDTYDIFTGSSLDPGPLSNMSMPSEPAAMSDAPPQAGKKRPRETFDCVLLPSRKAAPKQPRLETPSDDFPDIIDLESPDEPLDESPDDAELFEEKKKTWKNKNVNKKEDHLGLLPETLRARIRPIGFDVQDQHITVDPLTRDHMVTRIFMSETYGGNPQSVQPTIGRLHAIEHTMRDFFYLNTEFQPEAPEVPGAPGLFFCTEHHLLFGAKRVFTKIKDNTAKNDDKWLYIGQYDLCKANPPVLTVNEWKAQSPSFHTAWAKAIIKTKWGNRVRIEIRGHKLYGRGPTKAEREQIKANGSFKTITEEEVKAAFSRGEVQMGIWTAKCVNYDNAFQQELAEKFTPNWRPKTTKEREDWDAQQRQKLKLLKQKVKVKEETKVKVKVKKEKKMKKAKNEEVKTEPKQETEEEEMPDVNSKSN